MDLTKAIQIIKQFEGLKLEAYKCSAGTWTIGYGSTRYIDGSKVKLGDKINLVEAEHILLADVGSFASEIAPLISGLPIVPNQHCALLSLCYNIGITNFKKSTLLKLLKKGDLQGTADQFLVWNKAGGKVVQGLVNRRKMERELFLT